ncbi:MAG: hypothetical protein ACYC0X_33575 [Pirellulaceae bacterium]
MTMPAPSAVPGFIPPGMGGPPTGAGSPGDPGGMPGGASGGGPPGGYPGMPGGAGASGPPGGYPGMPGGAGASGPPGGYPGMPGGASASGPPGGYPGMPGGASASGPPGGYPGMPGGASASGPPGGYPGMPGGASASGPPGGYPGMPGGASGGGPPGGYPGMPGGASGYPGMPGGGGGYPGMPGGSSGYPGMPGGSSGYPGMPGGATGSGYPGSMGSGYPGAPGALPGSMAGAEEPAEPERETFIMKAERSMQQGNDKQALDYVYASAVAEEGTEVLDKFRWVNAFKRPAVAVRWGLGVQVTVSPKNYDGSYYPVGSTQTLPEKSSRTRRNDGQPRGGAGASGPGMMGPGRPPGGMNPGMPGSGGMYPGAPGAGAAAGSDLLASAAGEVGEELLRGLKERVDRDEYGEILTQLSSGTVRPAAGRAPGGPGDPSGRSSPGGGYPGMPGAGYPGMPGGGYPGMPGGASASGPPGGYPGMPGGASGSGPAGGYPGMPGGASASGPPGGYPGMPGGASGSGPAGGYPGMPGGASASGPPGGYPGMPGGASASGPPGGYPGMSPFGPGMGPGSVGGVPGAANPARLMAGVTMLGEGETEELLQKAADQGIDVLVVFEVEVTQNVKTNLVANETRIVVWNVAKRETLEKSKSLNNFAVQKSRAEGQKGDEDLVVSCVAKLFQILDEDPAKALKMREFPAEIRPEHVQSRVAAILSSEEYERLPALAEIKYFHHRGLVSDDLLKKSFQKVLGEEEGAKLATGKEEERLGVVSTLLPSDDK